MNIATIKVSGLKAVTNDYPTIPAGIVGATVTFEFTDPAWDGLNKTAVFRGCVTRDVLMTGNIVRIPAETVAQACPFLFVGVYGTDAADNLVIPTLWLSLGTVRDAADPSGDPGTDPDLPVWAQLQDRVEALESGTPSDPGSPDTPGRPGEDGEDGGYYTPAVTQPSSDTVEFAFSPSKPDMPAVDPVQVTLPAAPDSGGNVDLTGVVRSVNGNTPDENGNVEITVSGETVASVTDKPYVMQNIGVLYENPEGYDYVAWCPGNLRYDAVNDRYVSLVYGSTKHVAGTTALFVSYINPKTYEATAPVQCFTDDGATALSGSTAFWIEDDGTYKMLYKHTDNNNTYLYTSTDGGVNWVKADKVSGFSGSPWGITKLSNGRLIFGDDQTKVGIYYSDNGGINWTKVVPGTSGGDYEAEACILELKPGKLIAIARYSMSGIGYNASGDSEPAIVSYSDDYGTTWTAWKKSETITNMNASSCAGIVHNGMVDIFASSRWYWHGSNTNNDYNNTGKTGAITHYTATIENALVDNFSNNGIVTYAKAVGDGSSQDFHSPALAERNGEILLMWFDRIYPYSEEKTSHYFARGGIGGLMNYAPNDDVVSFVFPYSSAMVKKLLDNQYRELMTKINEIIISGGGTPDEGGDPENPYSYVFDGCIMNFNFLDSTKYDAENMTLTDSINEVKGTFKTAIRVGSLVTELPTVRDNSIALSYIQIPKSTLSEYITDDNPSFTLEMSLYREESDTTHNEIFLSDGGGTSALKVQRYALSLYGVHTDGSNAKFTSTDEGITTVFNNVATGQLIHGALVFMSDGTVIAYKNGAYSGKSTVDDFASWGGNNLTRGFGLGGYLRSARIYKRALTAEEVLTNYNYELSGIV